MPFDIQHDGFVHLIAGDPQGMTVYNSCKGDYSDLGCAAADIDDHITDRFRNRKTGPDCSRHWFFDQKHFPGACGFGRFSHRTLFNLCDSGRYCDDDSGSDKPAMLVYLFNKMSQHRFRDFKVGNDAIPHRADGGDIAGCSAQHVFCLLPDCQNPVFCPGIGSYRDNRWFAQDYP